MKLIKRILQYFLGLLVIAFGLLLTLLNPEDLNLNLGFKNIVLPLPAVVLIIFIFGLALGLFLGFARAYFFLKKAK